MFLISSKNFPLWYTIFKKKENYDLSITKLRYGRRGYKPILPTKFFINLSKKDLKSFRLNNFFNFERKQSLLFANLYGFKKFYKNKFFLQNKFKVEKLFFKQFRINHALFNSSKIINNSFTQFLNVMTKNFTIKRRKITKNNLKVHIFIKRLRGAKYNLNLRKKYPYKSFFFKKFKYKYGIRRKKILKKGLLYYFSKLHYYSKLKFILKKYNIYNFNNKKYRIKKRYKKNIFRLHKKILMNKCSHFVLPRLILFKLKVQLSSLKSKKYKLNKVFFFQKVVVSSLLDIIIINLKNKLLMSIQNKYRYNLQQKGVLFKTKHGSSFIIKNVGIIFPTKLIYKHSPFELYRVRKKIYSFLKKNEYKAHIFNSRKKQILWKNFFYNKKNFMVNSPRFNYEFFKKEFHLDSKFSESEFNTTKFINHSIFLKNNFFFNKNKNKNNFFGEVRISRIRFKPGYQKLWRGFREALSELINYKHVYQKQLTNYLTRFYRKIHRDYFSQNENSIDKILLYSKLLPDKSSLNSFFNNRMIFLNTKKVDSLLIYVYKNDFIQIEISNWYYIFTRWLSKLTKNRNLKFKRLVFKKGMSNKYKLMKQKKQRSNYTPNWITSSKYDFQDIKSFLEVDFMTLSLFVVYDYSYFYYYTPIDFKLINYNIYKMYNWKYLT